MANGELVISAPGKTPAAGKRGTGGCLCRDLQPAFARARQISRGRKGGWLRTINSLLPPAVLLMAGCAARPRTT